MATSNAAFYVFTSPEFEDPGDIDREAFFASGERDVDDLLTAFHVPPNPNWRVLDIGSGLGRLTRHLNQRFGDVVGIDVSKVMVQEATRLNPGIEFRESSGDDLSLFEDEQFDMVFSYIVLQHLPRQSLALKYIGEIARVLKPGGLALIQIPTSYYPRVKRSYWDFLAGRPKHYKEKVAPRSLVLSAGLVQRHAHRTGMSTEMVLFEGSRQACFRLAKGDVNDLSNRRRKAGERPAVLKKLLGEHPGSRGTNSSSHSIHGPGH